ncbi:MAG: gamma-glutamyl-gamma-aminobutyrate hydrolase family protein [Clostridiales bacterium]|nr:gamma-glutamyl-gamma-aminobutyrate hydrolase family protein [Clostridiales bacterium]
MITIGIGTNWDPNKRRVNIPNDYMTAVMRAGALPVLFPMTDAQDMWDAMVNLVDGVIFPGGEDIAPHRYGEDIHPNCGTIIEERDRQELYTFGQFLKRGTPFLAICRGIQLVNVYAGGSLYQDIKSQYDTDIDHAQFSVSVGPIHDVQLRNNTLIRSASGQDTLQVNSRHHQAVKALGEGLVVSGTSPDGMVESIEYANGYPGIAVQWHPENLAKGMPASQALFNWLVQASSHKR